jgi:hypothetical protein
VVDIVRYLTAQRVVGRVRESKLIYSEDEIYEVAYDIQLDGEHYIMKDALPHEMPVLEALSIWQS